MEKFCIKRQDLIIETKVHILDRIRLLDPKHDAEKITLLFWLFDLLPNLDPNTQCKGACEPCRFPHCSHAKPIHDILRAARDNVFLQVNDPSRRRYLWEEWHPDMKTSAPDVAGIPSGSH